MIQGGIPRSYMTCPSVSQCLLVSAGHVAGQTHVRMKVTSNYHDLFPEYLALPIEKGMYRYLIICWIWRLTVESISRLVQDRIRE